LDKSAESVTGNAGGDKIRDQPNAFVESSVVRHDEEYGVFDFDRRGDSSGFESGRIRWGRLNVNDTVAVYSNESWVKTSDFTDSSCDSKRVSDNIFLERCSSQARKDLQYIEKQ
jgi:hypothetical protein